MLRLFALIAAVGLLASAKPVPAQDKNEASNSTMFLFTADSHIYVAEFNGDAIDITDKKGREDRGVKPTWIVQSKSGFLVSDANQGALIGAHYDEGSKSIAIVGSVLGSPLSIGTRQMAYNKASTRLVAATGRGIDIWDSSASDGNVHFIGSALTGNDSLGDSSTTYVVADPSGKIFVVSDRSANSLIILSALDDRDIKFIGTIDIEESCGPRRGAFYAADGQNPTRYFALCQITKELLSFEVNLSAGTFKLLQKLQTSVETTADKRSVADLVLHSNNDRSADSKLLSNTISAPYRISSHLRPVTQKLQVFETGHGSTVAYSSFKYGTTLLML